jgi:hypothetical protein
MITKLTLTNFKNFKQAEIAFGPVSILVGANATGKSNVRPRCPTVSPRDRPRLQPGGDHRREVRGRRAAALGWHPRRNT